MAALFQKIDCLNLRVAELEPALAFYRDELGHPLIWRSGSAAGLRIPGSSAELVLHTEDYPTETDLMVESVPAAIARFLAAGGRLVSGPHEIAIGLCAVMEDPWGNRLVMLDASKGQLKVDGEGNVIP